MKDKNPLNPDLIKSSVQEGQNNSYIQSKIVVVVLAVTLLLWLTSPFHNISVSAVSAIPIVVLTLTGIIKEEDIKTLPWDVLLLIAGSMSLGLALESTGILKMFADKMGGINPGTIPFMIIIAFVSMILSNVMSNTATSAILLPLAFAALPGFEKETGIIIALASSAAIFLPVSTPPNAIVYSTGLLKIRDFSFGGIIVGILGPLLAVLWVMIVSRGV